MEKNVQQALKGNVKAINNLCEARKKRIFYLCRLLSENKGRAVIAVKNAYKDVLSNISSHNFTTEEEFDFLVTQKAVDYCKRRDIKKDSKAFYLPKKKNFLIGENIKEDKHSETVCATVLNSLTTLQKYIFVLNSVGEYQADKIAKILNINVEAVYSVLEVLEINTERIFKNLNADYIGYSEIIHELKIQEEKTEVPIEIDVFVNGIIKDVSKTVTVRRNKKVAVICAVILSICLVIGGIAAAITGIVSKNETETQTTASSSSDASELLGNLLGTLVDALGEQ